MRLNLSSFFIEGRHESGAIVALDAGDAHKAVSVLRMHDGDEIEAIDSTAQRFRATVRIDGRRASALLGEKIEGSAAGGASITIAQGVPKGRKMDFVVEKLTELGASSIVPLQSERTIVTDVSANKLLRWRRLAKSAAAQCGRAAVPAVEDAVTFASLIERFPTYDCVLLPWESAKPGVLRTELPQILRDRANVLVLVGPEGGFSHREADAAQKAGAHAISLGTRILRTETAALVLVSIVNYLMEE